MPWRVVEVPLPNVERRRSVSGTLCRVVTFEGWDKDGPWLRCVLDDGTRVEVLAGLDLFDDQGLWRPEAEIVDVHVYTPDGQHLTGEFMSVAGLAAWFERETHPYWTSNLVVIREPSLDAVRDAVRELLVTGEAASALLVCED